jgi:hypothetical protein
MEIKRIGSQPSTKGSAEYFTGTVRIDPLFQHTIQHGQSVPVLRLSLVHVLHGMSIH